MLIPCKVSQGLRDKEALVEVTDFFNNAHTIPLDKDFVEKKDGKTYLPVRIIHLHEKDRAALIALPVESDSGAHRIWVKREGAILTEEMPA